MIEIGSSSATALFRARHAAFFEQSAVLERAVTLAFGRALKVEETPDAVIFFLGSRCADDFREILLLAANNHGWGATAQVRGMFERCVTAAYLHEHPECAQDFVDYDVVRRWKVAQAIEKAYAPSPEDKAKSDELRSLFDEVKDRFMITGCKKCGEPRLNHTWSKLDVVAMSGKIETFDQMKNLVSMAYYLPLAQAHSTLASAIQRIGEVGGGYFAVDETLAVKEADRSLKLAHLLLLNALSIQQEHFALPELAQPLEQAFTSFKVVWPTREPIDME